MGESYYDEDRERRARAYVARSTVEGEIRNKGFEVHKNAKNWPDGDDGTWYCLKDGVIVGEGQIDLHVAWHVGLRGGIF